MSIDEFTLTLVQKVTCINKYVIPTTVLVFFAWSGSAGADVAFTGLQPDQDANARAILPLASARCDSAPWRIERLFREADKSIQDALEALGYYDIAIEKSLAWDDTCWQAAFEVAVGEPTRLRDVGIVIDGDAGNDRQFESEVSDSRPLPGDILNHGHYEAFKSALLNSAIGQGYFDASFSNSEVSVYEDVYAADIDLRLQSGVQYLFGDIEFSEGILRQSVLDGFSTIRPGDPYNAQLINDLYSSLNGSNYFESVSITTEPLNKTDKTVPVSVELTPGKRRMYSVGAGFATDTGPQGKLGYLNRRRNDKGHQFESKLFGSSVLSEFTTSYRWPVRDPRREWFSIVGGVRHEDTETSESDTFKLGVLLTRSVSSTWLETRYADFEFEKFKVGDQDTSTKLLIFGINRESAIGRELSRARNGRRLNFDLRGASEYLGSDTSFLQFRAKAKWVHSFGESTRIMGRIDLGLTAKESLTELPSSVRYFAGGDNSVRGYDYETLGPTDTTGAVVGGSHLLTGSIEVDRLVKPQWAIAAFVDSGSAFNGTDIDLSTGAGIGIRWYSPVGPVRFDIAHPFDDPDQTVRLHIGLGPDL